MRATSLSHTASSWARWGRRLSLRNQSRHRRERELALSRIGACPCHHDALPAGPGQELLGQPRLADAGLSTHQDEARSPRAGLLPGRPQALPLPLATDKAGSGRDGRSPSRAGAGCVVQAQQSLVDLTGCRTRLDTQLTAQHRHAGMVHSQGAGAIAGQREQAHERAIGIFREWVVPYPGLRVPNRERRSRAVPPTVAPACASARRNDWRRRSRSGTIHSS